VTVRITCSPDLNFRQCNRGDGTAADPNSLSAPATLDVPRIDNGPHCEWLWAISLNPLTRPYPSIALAARL
jgi:hypothetical protein